MIKKPKSKADELSSVPKIELVGPSSPNLKHEKTKKLVKHPVVDSPLRKETDQKMVGFSADKQEEPEEGDKLSLMKRMKSYKERHAENQDSQGVSLEPKENHKVSMPSGIMTKMQLLAYTTSNRQRKLSKIKEVGSLKMGIKKWYLVDPKGKFKKTWESIKFVLLIYQFFYLPVRMCLYDNEISTFLYAFDKAIDCLLCIDIILNFFTPVYFMYELATDVKIIAKSYLKSWFAIDILSLFPFGEFFDLVASDINLDLVAQLIRLMRFLRLARLIKLLRTLDFKNNDNYVIELLERTFKGTAFILLLPNFLIIFLIMHIFSCIWFAIGNDTSTNQSWMSLNKFRDESLLDKYIVSFYFIVQTFTTTGYGDIQSKSNLEFGFRILMMFLAVMIYGLFSGQIVNYRNGKMEEEEQLHMKVQKLDEMKAKFKLDDVLYRTILERLSENKDHKNPQQHDLSALNKEELEMLDYSLFIHRFKSHSFFENDEKYFDFQVKLGRLMKRKIYKKDQLIYSKGEDAVLFYIIISGSVTVMKDDIDELPVLLITNSYFGEKEILESCPRKNTVKAFTDCDIYYIESLDFKKLFMSEPSFYDEFLIKSKERQEKITTSCKELDHLIIRKLFWRKALKGKSRNQKKTFKKLVMTDQYKHRRNSSKMSHINRALKHATSIGKSKFDDDD